MPATLLPVPHRTQSDSGLCLPACVQMVLAHHGEETSEQDLADLFGVEVPVGVAFASVQRMANRGYRVDYGALSTSDLRRLLDDGVPIICRLWTVMLDYWPVESSHVALIIGYDDTHVYLNDPAFTDAPQLVLWDGFLAAWEEYDFMAAVLIPA